MKLELKHWSPYLPYNLKLQVIDTKTIFELKEYFVRDGEIRISGYGESKPILRPLSDLTKVIEVDAEKFIPIDKLEIDSCFVGINSVTNMPVIYLDKSCLFVHSMDVYNNIFELLLSWHFDLFTLIENKLAININDLN